MFGRSGHLTHASTLRSTGVLERNSYAGVHEKISLNTVYLPRLKSEDRAHAETTTVQRRPCNNGLAVLRVRSRESAVNYSISSKATQRGPRVAWPDSGVSKSMLGASCHLTHACTYQKYHVRFARERCLEMRPIRVSWRGLLKSTGTSPDQNVHIAWEGWFKMNISAFHT